MRRGATPFSQLAIPATELKFEYEAAPGNWQVLAKLPSPSQEMIWEDWNVFLEDLPEGNSADTKVRVSVVARIPAPSPGAGIPVKNWHSVYKPEVLKAGLIQVGNADRLRRMQVAGLKQLPDGEILFEAAWEATVGSISGEITLETVLMASKTLDVAPGVGVFPGTVVASTNNVIVRPRRVSPPGTGLFDYKWADFREPSNGFSSGQLFAVDLESFDRPTIWLNSAVKDLRELLTTKSEALANQRLKAVRSVLERSLASMIAESIGSSVASQLVEAVIEALDEDMTREALDNLDISQVLESVKPHVRTIAGAWSSWMSPRGGEKNLEAMCRELAEDFIDKGSVAFHAYLHDQLPRQLRENLKAEDSVKTLLAMADISDLLEANNPATDFGDDE